MISSVRRELVVKCNLHGNDELEYNKDARLKRALSIDRFHFSPERFSRARHEGREVIASNRRAFNTTSISKR